MSALQDYPIEKWYEHIMETANEIHCSFQYCGFSE